LDIGHALTRYLSERAHKLDSYAHSELHRFARAMRAQTGGERPVDQLKAPHVAGYAEREVANGGDVHARLRPVKEFLTYLSKKGFHTENLSTHVKIPRPSIKGGAVSTRPAFQTMEMTQSGLEARKKELADLKGQRPEIVQAIRTAAADKDFRENAPLDAAREEQGKIEARIRDLEEEIRRAEVIDAQGGSGVGVGATVTLRDMDSGKDVTYTIVDTMEADPISFKISVSSPVGAAIAGRSEGAQVSVQTPKGARRYQISKVKF
jgi:transcription elongation factor GreA